MFPFASTAYAMPSAGGEGGGGAGSALAQFFPIIIIFVIFYFFVIRPQSKKAKAHRTMVSALKKGDEVVTDSGIFGKVQKVADDQITIEIAPKVSIKLVRSRVTEVVKPAGTPATKSESKQDDEAETEE